MSCTRRVRILKCYVWLSWLNQHQIRKYVSLFIKGTDGFESWKKWRSIVSWHTPFKYWSMRVDLPVGAATPVPDPTIRPRLQLPVHASHPPAPVRLTSSSSSSSLVSPLLTAASPHPLNLLLLLLLGDTSPPPHPFWAALQPLRLVGWWLVHLMVVGVATPCPLVPPLAPPTVYNSPIVWVHILLGLFYINWIKRTSKEESTRLGFKNLCFWQFTQCTFFGSNSFLFSLTLHLLASHDPLLPWGFSWTEARLSLKKRYCNYMNCQTKIL